MDPLELWHVVVAVVVEEYVELLFARDEVEAESLRSFALPGGQLSGLGGMSSELIRSELTDLPPSISLGGYSPICCGCCSCCFSFPAPDPGPDASWRLASWTWICDVRT